MSTSALAASSSTTRIIFEGAASVTANGSVLGRMEFLQTLHKRHKIFSQESIAYSQDSYHIFRRKQGPCFFPERGERKRSHLQRREFAQDVIGGVETLCIFVA